MEFSQHNIQLSLGFQITLIISDKQEYIQKKMGLMARDYNKSGNLIYK